MRIKTIGILMGLLLIGWNLSTAAGDEPQREGPWFVHRDAAGLLIQTAKMTIHPAAEPVPALKHRLLPDDFDTIDGNAAVYYLKAMGFLEQSVAAKQLQEFKDKNRQLAQERGVEVGNLPPYSWLDLPPDQIPLSEVKEYLNLTSFQIPLMAEATRRRQFSLDRDTRNVASPIAVLLPEIQQIRELARLQSLRFRVAIAEHRPSDAVKILGEQFALGKHLGTDEFLVSNLVGAAVLGIAMQDALYLLQDPQAPNCYWALSSLPVPVLDMTRALSLERQFFNLQLKALQEVDETPRSASYWQDFVDRILPQLREIELVDTNWLGSKSETERAAFVTTIAAAYPGAKRFLIEECQMDQAKVEAYPTAQVVFLAAKLFNQRNTDEHFKWMSPAYHAAIQHPQFKSLGENLKKKVRDLGWAGEPSNQLLSAITGIRTAQARIQQQLGLLQTIEAVRMYAALHPGQLPTSLKDLPYPVPNDAISGQPFQYELKDNRAYLNGTPLPYMQYRIELQIAK